MALADFAALCFFPRPAMHEFCDDLWSGKYQAHGEIAKAFSPLADEPESSPRREAPAPPWIMRTIPAGYSVVEDDTILTSYLLTSEGRASALALAGRLAESFDRRNALFGRYLINIEESDVLVYAFDGSRVVLEHLARVVEDDVDADEEDEDEDNGLSDEWR